MREHQFGGWGDNSGQCSGCLFPALMQQSFPSGDREACPEPSSQVTTPQPSLWQPYPLPQCLLFLLFESHFLRELTTPWSVPQCPAALSCPPGTLAWNVRSQKSQVRHSEAGRGFLGAPSEHFLLWEQRKAPPAPLVCPQAPEPPLCFFPSALTPLRSMG